MVYRSSSLGGNHSCQTSSSKFRSLFAPVMKRNATDGLVVFREFGGFPAPGGRFGSGGPQKNFSIVCSRVACCCFINCNASSENSFTFGTLVGIRRSTDEAAVCIWSLVVACLKRACSPFSALVLTALLARTWGAKPTETSLVSRVVLETALKSRMNPARTVKRVHRTNRCFHVRLSLSISLSMMGGLVSSCGVRRWRVTVIFSVTLGEQKVMG